MSIIFFFLGAIAASFLGLVSVRLYTGHSIFFGRSRCDACNAPLAPFTLVPIISYLVSRGRSRCCEAKISLLAPLSELLLGLVFVLAYLKLDLSLSLGLFLVGASLLLGLVLYDLAHQILPPVLLYSFVAAALLFALARDGFSTALTDSLLWAFCTAAFFLALHYGSKGRAMGFADAPLSFALALLVGPEFALSGLAFSFWIGAIIGITILLRRRRGSRMGIEVPFAPFLAAGYMLVFFTQWNPFAFIVA